MLALALLGCARELSPGEWVEDPSAAAPQWAPPPLPTLAELGETCVDGELPACVEAITRAAEASDYAQALLFSDQACAAGGLDSCYWGAMYERVLGQLDASRARIVEACARGHATSCEVERHDQREVALDRHLELWRCLDQVAPIDPSTAEELWISFNLVDEDQDGAATVELDPIPDRPILQACVGRALASTEFAMAAPHRSHYRLRLDPSVVADKLASLGAIETAVPPTTIPSPDACPEHGSDCESVPLATVMRVALFVPEHGLGDSVTDPGLPPVTVDFCIDPVTGKTRRIRPSRAWLGDTRTTRVVERIAGWRFFPIEVDGAPTLACTRVEFDLDQTRPEVDLVSGGWLPPQRIAAAQPVYAPLPTREQFVRIKAARTTFGARRRPLSGYNVTHYCVDERGKVSLVETRQRYPHNRLVDQLLRETISRWRFRPLIIDGVPHVVCMDQRFKIVLE